MSTWNASFYDFEFGMHHCCDTPELWPPTLAIPPELRGKAVRSKELVEGLAAHHGLKLAWAGGGRQAVLYRGTPDDQVRGVVDDLRSPKADVRRMAAWRAGRLEDVRMVEPLLDAVRDSDAGVSATARYSLVKLGLGVVGAVAGEKALPVLEDACGWKIKPGRRVYDVTDSACMGIARIGGDKALAALERLRHDKGSMGYAVMALMCFDDDRSLPILEQLAASGGGTNAQADVTNGMAKAAFTTLGSMRDRAVVVLERLGQSSNAWVRQVASHELHWIASIGQIPAYAVEGAGTSDRKPITPAEISDCLRQEQATIPRDVVRGLDAMDRVAASKLLERMAFAANESPCTKGAVTEALSWYGGSESLALLGRLAVSTNNEPPATRITQSLWQIGGADRNKVLLSLANNTNANARITAALAFGHIVTAETRAALDKLARDAEASVRCAAACALGQIGDEWAMTKLERLTDDPEPYVRRLAYKALLTVWKDDVWRSRTEPILAKFLATERDDNVREDLNNHVQWPPDAELAAARKWLTRDDAALRKQAIVIHNAWIKTDWPAGASIRETLVDAAVPGYVLALRDVDTNIVHLALQGIQEGRLTEKELLPEVLRLLVSSNADIRASAATCLGEFRSDGRDAAPALVHALEDSDGKVQYAAAVALGKVGGSFAFQALLRNLDNGVSPVDQDDPPLQTVAKSAGSSFLQHGIVVGLGEVGDPRAVDPLLLTLWWSARREVSDAAVSSLGHLADRRAIGGLIVSFGFSPHNDGGSSPEQFGVLVPRALGIMCSESDIERLLKLLRRRFATSTCNLPSFEWDKDAGRIRGSCLYGNIKNDYSGICLGKERIVERDWALKEIQNLGHGPGELPSVEVLTRALDAKWAATRVAAVFLLLERNPENIDDAVWRALIRHYHSPYPWVSRTVDSLLKNGQAEAQLAATLRSDDWFIRLMTAEALMPVRREAALAVLLPALKDPDPWCRLHALRALDRTLGPEAADVFLPLLADKCWAVRMYAVSALGTRDGPKSIKAVADALADPEQYVRIYAAMALCEMNSVDVMDSLIRGLKDENEHIARVVAIAITRADKSGGHEAFRRAVDSKDEAIQARAKKILAPLITAATSMPRAE